MKANLIVVVAVIVATLPACARLVVLDPELAAQKNSKDWTVKSEPGKAAAPKVPASTAGAATQAAPPSGQGAAQ